MASQSWRPKRDKQLDPLALEDPNGEPASLERFVVTCMPYMDIWVRSGIMSPILLTMMARMYSKHLCL